MSALLVLLMDVMLYLVTIAIGAHAVSNAIKCFKEKHYFLFGLELFVSIYMVFNLFKLSF